MKTLSDTDLEAIANALGIPLDDDWRNVWARDTKMCVLIDWLRQALRDEEARSDV